MSYFLCQFAVAEGKKKKKVLFQGLFLQIKGVCYSASGLECSAIATKRSTLRSGLGVCPVEANTNMSFVDSDSALAEAAELKGPPGSPLAPAGSSDYLVRPRRRAVFARLNGNADLIRKPVRFASIGPLMMLVAIFSAFAVALPAASQEAGGLPKVTPGELGFSVTHWTVEDGLPGRIITSLAQTPDGYLWCGSPAGLVRYDGARFTVFRPDEIPALKGVQVLELRCDPAGRLWIEGINGQLVVFDHGQFRRLGEADGIPADQAGKLGDVRAGDFWVKGRTDDRFFRWRAGRFEPVSFPGIPSSSIDRFLTDADGVRWGVREHERTMVRFTATGPEVQALLAPDGKSRAEAGRFFKLQDGNPAVTSSHGIYALKGTQWILRHRFSLPIVADGVLDGVEDWQGNFWVSVYGKGIVRSRPDGETSLVKLPDSGSLVFIRALLFGAEGNIWAAGDGGLYRLRRNAFRPPTDALAEMRNKTANTFLQDSKGEIWILYANGWARRTDAGWKFTAHPHPGAVLCTGAVSSDGSVILGYITRPASDMGFVEKAFPTGRTERLGSLAGNPRIILESQDGEIWVGTAAGLWRWETDRFALVQLPNAAGSLRGPRARRGSGRPDYRRGNWPRALPAGWKESVAAAHHCRRCRQRGDLGHSFG